MSSATDRKVYSATLALAVHLLFFVFLFFGFRWHTNPTGPIYVELWQDVPSKYDSNADFEADKSESDNELTSEPKPKPVPKTKPLLQPNNQPQPAPSSDNDADLQPQAPPPRNPKVNKALIELREKRRKLLQQRELLRQAREMRDRDIEKRIRDERQRQEQLSEAAERQRMNEVQAVRRSRQKEALLRKQMVERDIVENYKMLISNKVKQNLVLQPMPDGNPEVVFKVSLTPEGNLISDPVMVSSSGQDLYDKAVDKAIRKSDPLPVPDDRDVYAEYFNTFELRFRPRE